MLSYLPLFDVIYIWDLALSNLQRLIWHKEQPANQSILLDNHVPLVIFGSRQSYVQLM